MLDDKLVKEIEEIMAVLLDKRLLHESTKKRGARDRLEDIGHALDAHKMIAYMNFERQLRHISAPVDKIANAWRRASK